jgi:hypothetical protein
MAIEAKNRNDSRQYPMVAVQEINLCELETGVAIPAVKIPFGARVIGGAVVVSTPFNSTSTDTFDIGDGIDPNRYSASPINVHTAGYTALSITGYKYLENDFIDVTWTSGGGAPSTGVAHLIVMYVSDTKENEIVPSYV